MGCANEERRAERRLAAMGIAVVEAARIWRGNLAWIVARIRKGVTRAEWAAQTLHCDHPDLLTLSLILSNHGIHAVGNVHIELLTATLLRAKRSRMSIRVVKTV